MNYSADVVKQVTHLHPYLWIVSWQRIYWFAI